MTLEDVLIKINEEDKENENILSVLIVRKGILVLELYTASREKYWEYLTDELLTKKAKYNPRLMVPIIELQEG